MAKQDEIAAEKLRKELEGERAHYGENCMEDEVELEAEWGHGMLSNVLHAKVKKYRICT